LTARRSLPLLGRVGVHGRDVTIAIDATVWVAGGDTLYRVREILLTPDQADELARALALSVTVARRIP
jgi:hypothetical protein